MPSTLASSGRPPRCAALLKYRSSNKQKSVKITKLIIICPNSHHHASRQYGARTVGPTRERCVPHCSVDCDGFDTSDGRNDGSNPVQVSIATTLFMRCSIMTGVVAIKASELTALDVEELTVLASAVVGSTRSGGTGIRIDADRDEDKDGRDTVVL